MQVDFLMYEMLEIVGAGLDLPESFFVKRDGQDRPLRLKVDFCLFCFDKFNNLLGNSNSVT